MARVFSAGNGCPSRWPLVAIATLALLSPAAARAMGFGCTSPTVQLPIVNPNGGTNVDGSVNVGGGASETVECDATACSGYNVGELDVSFDGGTTWTTMSVTSANAVTGTTAWTVPVPASYPATTSLVCKAVEAERGYSNTSTLAVDIQQPPADNPPVVDSLTPSAASVFVGGSIQLAVSAHDPDGDPLTYAWSATGGTIVASGSTATWTGTTAGDFTVTVTVSDATLTASTSVTLAAIWASGYAPMTLTGTGFLPSRIAFDREGNAYVTNSGAGTVQVFTAKGGPFRTIQLGGYPSGVGVAPEGQIYVADQMAGRVSVLDPAGRLLRKLGSGDGEFQAPAAIAVHAASGRVYVAESGAGRVRIFDEGGSALGTLDLAPLLTGCTLSDGTSVPCPSGNPAGVALDPAGLRVYVSDSRYATVRVYDVAGSPLGTIGTFDTDVVRPAGLAVGPDGNLYVADSYEGRLAVFAPQSKALLAYIGEFGSGPGQLEVPLDVAADLSGRLAVTNSQNHRIEVYGLPSFAGVACPGDSDCDGMPDAWEIAHGLDPFNPADAWLDPDGDGLLNIEEYWHGTDPHKADTDGDGVSDGAEVLARTDPLDPTDHMPVANAGTSVVTAPTRVTLDGRGSHDPDGDALVYDWRQAAGPETVTLHGADTATPWFVAHAAGDYRFLLRAYDGKIWSSDSDVVVTVLDVSPTADAGPDFGATSGTAVTLDGRFSSDANRDALSYTWTQAAGPAVALSGASTARPSFTPAQTGIYAFDLVVSDGDNTSAPARVHVVVDAPGDHVPVAMVPSALDAVPVSGAVGVPATLDGSASVDADGSPLTYAWTQVDGPPAVLIGASQAVTSFAPDAPGVYRFELVVNDGQHDSLPEPVTVVVSGSFSPPLAAAGYDRRVRVLDDVALGCGFSFDAVGAVTCTFTQVEGVQVPLHVSGQTTTFVPIDPGTYVFELQVADANGSGTRDRVTVVVDADGQSVPAAAAVAAAGAAAPGSIVTLDGSSSSDADAGTTLGYAWRQVRGPRACVDDPRAGTAQVTPVVAGYYVFELRADDGALRSAPARVAFAIGDGANPPPLARAGDDVVVMPGTVTTLDGRSSTGATGWRWTQVGGPLGASLAGSDGAVLSVTPKLSGFTLRFRLGVTAGALTSVPDDVYVNVADVPLALQRVDASGGTVVVAKSGQALNGMSVHVPSGAFAGAVQLALGEVTRAWYAADGHEPLHGAILVGPVGEPLAQPISLQVPIGVRLKSNALPSDVQVVAYDEAAGDWKPVSGVVADLAGGTVSFPVARLGAYQVTLTAGLKATSSSGCGCAAGSGGGSGGSIAILVAVALLALPRRWARRSGVAERSVEGRKSMKGRGAAKVWGGLIAVALAFGAPPALGLDAPHDITHLTQTCRDCHMVHNAVGGGLTKTAGNVTLCLSCHGSQTNPVVAGWNSAVAPTGNQAVPGTGGSSHRWDAPGFAPKYGATGATTAQLDSSGNLMCSSCHSEHSQSPATFDIRSPATGAGRHFPIGADNTAQICTGCHAQWNYSTVASSTYLCASTIAGCTATVGTATFTATSATVTGSGTTFVTQGIKPGWRIKKASDPITAFTVIRAVTETTITLEQTYGTNGGTAGTNAAWEAAPTLAHPSNLAVSGKTFKGASGGATPTGLGPYDAQFYGVATGGSTSNVTVDGTKFVWAPNALSASAAPRYIRFTSGSNKDLVSSITGNSTAGGVTTITLGTTLSTAPAAGDTFEIGRVVQTAYATMTGVTSATVFADSSKASWPTTAVSGLTLTMVSASAATKANVGKTVSISSLSAGTFTVGAGLTITPAVGDVYRINWPANDSGTTASGTTTSVITDAAARNVAANTLVNLTVRITTHNAPNATQGDVATYFGQTRTITANNATNTITLSSAVTGLATSGDTYEIGSSQNDVNRGTATSGTTTTLTDSTKSWTSGALVGLSVRFLIKASTATPPTTNSYVGTVGTGNQHVVSTITANTATQITFVAVGTAVIAGDAYEIDPNGNMSNNLPLGGTATSFTAGNVVCLSCHSVHFADSKSSTYDATPPATPGAGDGKLLRRDNDDRFCTSCHAVKIHNSTNTSSTYGVWGTNFTCFTCHTRVHETTNLYLINPSIATPNSGTLNVDFRFASQAAAHTYGPVTGVACGTGSTPCGPCEVCHTKTTGASATARWRNTGNTEAAPHNPGGCTGGCHKHEAAFSKLASGSGESGGGSACAPCHATTWPNMNGTNSVVSKHTLGNVLNTNDSPTDTSLSWAGVTNLTDNAATTRSCVNMCHSDHPHDIGGTTTHEWNGYVDATTNATRSNGSANNNTTYRDNTDFDSTLTNGGMCVSCHQKPVSSTKPLVSKTVYAASAHNVTGNAYGTTTPWSYKLHDGTSSNFFSRNCTKCHADRGDANPQATSFGAVHSSGFPQLLHGNTNPGATGNTVAQYICYDCHGNGTTGTNLSGKDLATEVARTFNHPVGSDQVHDTVAEQTNASVPNTLLSGSYRHVNCIDCHNPHATRAVGPGGSGTVSTAQGATTPAVITDSTKAWTAGQWRGYTFKIAAGTSAGQTGVVMDNAATTVSVWFIGTAPGLAATFTYVIIPAGTSSGGAVPTAMTGTFGVAPTFLSQPAPPTWNDNPAAPTNAADNTVGQYTAIATWGQTTAPSLQGYVCIKCHSAYAYGASPPNTPSGLGTASATAWSNSLGGAMPQSDIANQFNPNNLSHHAVFARGKNQPVRATYGNYNASRTAVVNTNWPKYTAAGTVAITSGAAILTGAALPAAALPGWYIYIGSTTLPVTTPVIGSTSTGFLEITSIADSTHFSVRAEGATDNTWVTAITVGSTANWAVTAGLGNNFVPPWGPWSTLQCTDCHASDTATDTLGPHGSATKWLLKQYTAPTFLFWNGTAVASVAAGAGDANNLCLNCHRRDVYGDYGFHAPTSGTYSRQAHPADTSSGQAFGNKPKWGIVCMNCHGGARAGTIHGTNLGKGSAGAAGSTSGRRLLAGAYWYGVTRSSVATAGSCLVKGAADSVANCGNGSQGGFTSSAKYDYETSLP